MVFSIHSICDVLMMVIPSMFILFIVFCFYVRYTNAM